jgi:predicted nucleic acid-binding Zn ribbon protein
MKRHNTQKLGDVLKEVLQNQQLDTKLYELQLIQSWEKVLGPTVKRYTTNLYIQNKKLYVKLSSSILRNDLMLSREKLIEALNKQAGTSVIEDIIFR